MAWPTELHTYGFQFYRLFFLQLWTTCNSYYPYFPKIANCFQDHVCHLDNQCIFSHYCIQHHMLVSDKIIYQNVNAFDWWCSFLQERICKISGSCYGDGEANPDNTCLRCRVDTSDTEWTLEVMLIPHCISFCFTHHWMPLHFVSICTLLNCDIPQCKVWSIYV